MLEPVRVETVIAKSPRETFLAFTRDMTEWWPLATHSMSQSRLGQAALAVVVEPGEGGRILETAADGQIHQWGRVTLWHEFDKLAFDWHVGRSPDLATQVCVMFSSTDTGKTHVLLEHSNWAVLGAEAASVRSQYQGGWSHILCELFQTYGAKLHVTTQGEI